MASRRYLPLVWTMAALGIASALGPGCSSEVPQVCEVMLACFDPNEVDASFHQRYARCPDDPFYQHEDESFPNWIATEEAFGPGGACWAGGPGDPYYDACLAACEELVFDDCSRAESERLCQGALDGAGTDCAALGYDDGYERRTCAR